MMSTFPADVAEGAQAFDGVGRLFVYRRLPHLPIYVVHGYATATIRGA